MKSEHQRPRVVVDANVWLSYLLPSRQEQRSVDQLLQRIERERVLLVVPAELVRELRRTVARKPYLRRHILPEEFDAVLELLQTIGEMLPEPHAPIPALTRDRSDDYLLAAAVSGNVDILISGDADLLALRDHLDRPRIMTVREFVDEFDPE